MEFILSSGGDMGSSDDYELDYSDPDASLSPVERLEKYIESDHTFSRQLAVRILLETFQQVEDSADAEQVLKAVSVLANDMDGIVRTELCEHLLEVGNFCHENQKLFSADGICRDPLMTDILPILLQYMVDQNSQVRKTSHAAVAEMIEQRRVIVDKVISDISRNFSKLVQNESADELRSDAAALICKLAPIVGPEVMTQHFIHHFINLCTDPVFQVRKICAVNFGTVCQVMGRGETDSVLLEKFFQLCADGIWGVRKACAECFVQVSLVCSPAVRHAQLAHVFINLISDQSRWVRMSAYEALGAFISTFADPNITGLQLMDDGTLILTEPSIAQDTLRKEEETPVTGHESDVSLFNDGAIKNDGSLNHNVLLPHDVNARCDSEHVVTDNAVEGGTPTLHNSKTISSDSGLQGFNYANNGDAVDLVACRLQEFSSASSPENMNGVERTESSENIELTVEKLELNFADVSAGQNLEEGSTVTPTENETETSENLVVPASENHNIEAANQVEDVRWNLSSDATNYKKSKVHSDQNENVLKAKDEDTTIFSKELVNGLVDTHKLDFPAEDDLPRLSPKDNAKEFGSLNFWQDLIPALDTPSSLEVISDEVVRQCVDNCLILDSSSSGNPANSLSLKLRDSVSHLTVEASEPVKTNPLIENEENNERLGNKIVTSPENVNGVEVTELCTPETIELTVEKLVLNFTDISADQCLGEQSTVVNDESSSVVTPMDCDDDDLMTSAADNKTKTSGFINELETEEIPLDDDVNSLGNGKADESCQPVLEMLEETSSSENTPMEIGDEVGYYDGIEVDEEEVRELVAAVKDLPCDDVAIYEQNVVPRDLLEQYLSMMDPSCAQKVDSEITRHCAYSLPAVAYTLGRKHWPSLKNLYTTLAADVQWKVRRTLAFSIHELALIVGEEVTTRDLVPVFDGFLNDLDEVRIGVLKHLADFLKLLPTEARHGYLLKIAELLKTDNSRNWRFREELARQLYQLLLLDLFSSADIQEHISPIALHLADDRVAQVRQAALRVLSQILKRLIDEVENDGRRMWSSYMGQLNAMFAQSQSCLKRQMYVQLCDCILQDRVLSEECFAEEFLPTLLPLHRDTIPNVRLTLARTIAHHIIHSAYFAGTNNPHYKELIEAVTALQEDRDRDVRFLIDQKLSDVTSSSPPFETSA